MQAGIDVEVLEAQATAGGNVQTMEVDGFRLEGGPHTFMPSADAIVEVAREAGLADKMTASLPAAKKRFIVRQGRMRVVFGGPLSFLASRLLSFRGKLRLLQEPFRTRQRGDPTDTAERFFVRRFGPEAARVLAGAFISGVYAGDISRLSAPAAFPLFWRFEQEHGSMIRGAMKHRRQRRAELAAAGRKPLPVKGLLSFSGGLGTLTATLAAKLGPRLHLDTPVRGLARQAGGWRVEHAGGSLDCRALVLAVPPGPAASLLEPLDAEAAGAVTAVPMAPVAVVHLGFERRCAEIPDGFGFLAPRGQGVRSLGVLFPSRLFADRTPPGGELLTAFIGGVHDAGALALDDGPLADIALADLRTLTGLGREPALVQVRRYPEAIPQLVCGHLERMELLRQRLHDLPGLLLAGNYLQGVGLKDAVASGVAAAREVAVYLQQRGGGEGERDHGDC